MAMHRPPFPIPAHIKNRDNYIWVERMVPELSDGDATKWPKAGSGYRSSPNEFYLCHLGQKWAEQDGLLEEGVHYYLNKLPEGYAMFEINQPSGPQVYKRLFGHPSGKFYDSALRFTPHFLWLTSGMKDECLCTTCSKKSQQPRVQSHSSRGHISGLLPERSRSRMKDNDDSNSEPTSQGEPGLAQTRAQRRPRQTGELYAKDEEGDEDIYKDCVKKAELARGSNSILEIDITEESSVDWKAERECLPQYLTQVEQQHTFVPRVGELVLWCPKWPDDYYLFLDPTTSEYRFYSFLDKKFHGKPEWRGGIVASVPSDIVKNGSIDFQDILDLPSKQTALSTAGFRIETMPDPNDDVDKSASKQYRYLPLRNIRPLSLWQLLARAQHPEKLHTSIMHALTCMTAMSLLEKWRFLGEWPHGRILCKGIYLGSELITVGDTIRIFDAANAHQDENVLCEDVLVVTSIRYNIIDMTPEHVQASIPSLSSSSYVSFVGQAYTTNELRCHRKPLTISGPMGDNTQPTAVPLETIKAGFRSVGANAYGPWYPLHDTSHKYEVSHERVLGRLYEADAVRLWTGQRQMYEGKHAAKPTLGYDVGSILAARRYATASDERLPEPARSGEINWYLADTRVQALGISSLNGLDVGRYHAVRDSATTQRWRYQVKVADGRDTGTEPTKDTSMVSWSEVNVGKRGRPAGSRIINGKLVRPDEVTFFTAVTSEAPEENKPSSQMSKAALASDSEEETSQNDGDDEIEEEDTFYNAVETPTAFAAVKSQLNSRREPTKQEIMAGVNHEDDTASDVTSDDESDEDAVDWLKGPVVLRGGTEESEGGDYRE